jgi:tetratricopeptide (TPR) repeat protein
VAREVFQKGNAELAWWHWDYLTALLAPACRKDADLQDEEVRGHRALAAEALGALSTCQLQLGRTREARADALKCLEILEDRATARDALRLAAAAAAHDDQELALEACARGLAFADLGAFEIAAFARIKSRVARARRRHTDAERAFCRRIFA